MQSSKINLPRKMGGWGCANFLELVLSPAFASLSFITACVMFRRPVLTRLSFTASWINSTTSSRHTLIMVGDSDLRHAGGMFLAPWTQYQRPDEGLFLWKVILVSSSRHPDQWIVPGGGMEPEEEPCGAAVREVYEEVSASSGRKILTE